MLLLFMDALFLTHETGRHPENPQRLRAVHEKISAPQTLNKCKFGFVQPATPAAISAVHTPEYLEELSEISSAGGGWLDADTVMSAHSLDVARCAAGAACEAVRQVCAGPLPRALCLIRPPGHHALPQRAMGFCLLNNVAIAARFAQQNCGIQRILIVDWDVHHGNGTQEIFYEDGQVVYFSAHRYPFYPGTGAAEDTGTGPGLGATFNLPVPFGTSRADYLSAFQETLEKAVARARPELILISAGFDAHRLDPIGSLGLETEDFGTLTELVRSAARSECGGRIVSLLEGGYHPDALADSVCLHLDVLADD